MLENDQSGEEAEAMKEHEEWQRGENLNEGNGELEKAVEEIQS